MLRDPKRNGNRSWYSATVGYERSSFTLVELLVVISIIALLISILLPSLKKARDQAKEVACAASKSGLSKANAIYGSEWNGWFVGSPATTGQQLYRRGTTPPPDERFTPGEPVQIWDWAGPILAQTAKSLRANRAARWRELVEGQFACASNTLPSVPFPAPAGPPLDSEDPGFHTQKMVSYNTMRSFMTRAAPPPSGSPPPNIADQYFRTHVGGTEQPPYGYEPRIERVGNASEKVFLADGARFTTDDSKVDHAFDWKARSGGGFSSEAPTAPDSVSGSTILRSYKRSKAKKGGTVLYEPRDARNAYRHPHGQKLGLNAVFFDGHVEYMSEDQSRWPDPWWPKDSVIPAVGEMNPETRALVLKHLTARKPAWWPESGSPPLHYRVR